MSLVTLEVNGRKVTHEAPARMHLGDFLRDQVRLTGTHLGCEHGVCGACTVLVDGQPTRSCIAFAVACEGRQVTTIEGYEDDAIMRRLRAAFTAHHALQCGYCTPGMLTTARDIVLRLPDADEARVRVELSGNLCRCTGYMGIVAAVMSVLRVLREDPDEQVEALRTNAAQGRMGAPEPARGVPGEGTFKGFVPVMDTAPAAAVDAANVMARGAAGKAASQTATAMATTAGGAASAQPGLTASDAASGAASGSANSSANSSAAAARTDAKPAARGNRIEGGFDLPFPAATVWAFMVDLPAVAGCLPGAVIHEHHDDRVKGGIAIKFGPMSAAFNGAARLDRDDAAMRAVFRGAGQDTLSQSRANGDISYHVQAVDADNTRVDVELAYSLQGPLAQFSRSGLVQDFVRRMIQNFGNNVAARLRQPAGEAPLPAAPLNPAALFFSIIWGRIKRLFGRGS